MKHYRKDIDGLRALAVLPVVLFHVGFSGIPGGFVGVDVFFVISGYLITASLLEDIGNRQFSIANFYRRRIKRIMPAYFVLILFVCVAGFLLQMPSDLKDLGVSIVSSSTYVSNISFWMESGDYFGVKSELQPLLHTWSLSVEEQFYIFFPLVLWLACRIRNGSLVWHVLAALFAISFCLSIYATSVAPVANFYLLPTRAWELLAGSMIALRKVRARPVMAEFSALLGVALVTIPIFIYSGATPFPGLTALPPVLGACLVIHAGTGERATWVARLLSTPFLRFFGLISYSLYLWHWPIIVFARYYFIEIDLPLQLMILPLSILISTISWRYVECPFRRPALLAEGPALFALTVALALVLATTGLAFARDGMPWRMPSTIVRMSEKNNYRGPPRRCGEAYKHRRTIATLCIRGRPHTRPDFLLIGDSHADAIAEAFFEAADQTGRAGYQMTDTGYRPVLGFQKIGEEDKYRYLNDLAVRLLDSDPGIRDVALPIYWHQAVDQDRYRKEGGGYDGRTALRAGLEALIARNPGRRFLFILPAAHSLAFGGNAAARAAWYRYKSFDPVVSRTRFDAEKSSYWPILEALAQYPNVQFVSLADKLCDAHACHGFLNGHVAYADDNHISYYASQSIKPEVEQWLLGKFSGKKD